MDRSPLDVAIIGAGPYGLSLATHLQAQGVTHRIFGPPMQTWRSMSPGMYLKSRPFATSIATPDSTATLPHYCAAQGMGAGDTLPIATFAEYGLWVQQRLVPYVEETMVTRLAQLDDHFAVTLESGERVLARRVAIAVGLTSFEHVPEPFSTLPSALVSHTAQHGDFSGFAGRDVTVLGAGQSALQAAALLHEHGAHARIIARGDVHWGSRPVEGRRRGVIDRVRSPRSVLGDDRKNWVLEHAPMLPHYVPTEKRVQFTRKHLGPSGAWWLRDRVEGKLPIHRHTSVRRVTVTGGRLCLRIAEGGVDERDIITDHLIAGTGFEVDVDRLAFISPDLAREIRRVERAPRLSRHFEASVRGLYFIGPASAFSFGPLFRFVAGAAYTAPVVARHLARTAPSASFRRLAHTAMPAATDAPTVAAAMPAGEAALPGATLGGCTGAAVLSSPAQR